MEFTTTPEAEMTATYMNQTTPAPTLKTGTHVITGDDIAYVGGWNSQSRHKGQAGVIVGYATADLQKKQVWPWESYYVILDGERGQRVLNRDALIAI